MPDSIERVDEEIEKQSLLKHRFYVMWSEGKLGVEQLAGYSREYFQLVKVVPELVSNVMSLTDEGPLKMQIGKNLSEEIEHIEPWIKFAAALGVTRSELEGWTCTERTLASTQELDSITKSSFLEGVAAMYAYEKQLPAVSRSKVEGLTKFYGINAPDALRYFELHEVADIEHAEVWRGILRDREERQDLIVTAALRSLKAQNALLDSVVANYC